MEESTASIIRCDPATQIEKFCKFIHRHCHQTRIDGYDYCIRHILEDKSAPFRQCTFVHVPTKKKCPNAAPMSEIVDRNNILCPFHVKEANVKEKPSTTKIKVVQGPAALLKRLENYCRDPAHDKKSKKHEWITASEPPSTLNQIEAAYEIAEPITSRNPLDSLSVDEEFSFNSATNVHCLENAGAYTQKDILRITRDKIQRLQELYFEELKVVCREMKENRRQFLSELKQLKQSSSNSSNLSEDKLKALKLLSNYNRRSNAQNLLRKRAKDAEAKVPKPPITLATCTFSENDIQCLKTALPLTNFCTNHILLDPKQVLYKPCGLGRNCRVPLIPFDDNPACDIHFALTLKKSVPVSDLDRPSTSTETLPEPEPFQSMDDIASLGLDAITPGSLFGLDQFGDPGESTDTVPSDDEDPFRNSLLL